MSQADAFKNLARAARKNQATPGGSEAIAPSLPPAIVPAPIVNEKRGRGRPATGKRSDEEWIGRTFYVKRETDLDVEDELLKLKRQDVNLDKSDLVEALLAAWVKFQQGENSEFRLSEIAPRRK
jgi:hypothetical protein